MEMNALGIHIHELRNQCRYIEANIGILNQSLEQQAPVGVFFTLQGIVTAASQVSRILWTSRKKGKQRAEELRERLALPEKHPMNNESLLTLWDFSDEVNDQWIAKTKGEYILYDFIGDIAESQHKEVKIENIYRAFDTKTNIYTFRGVGFNMGAMLKAVADVANRVNQLHQRMFPDQWKAEEEFAKKMAEERANSNADEAAPASEEAPEAANTDEKAKAE